jgi:hypothetical protein
MYVRVYGFAMRCLGLPQLRSKGLDLEALARSSGTSLEGLKDFLLLLFIFLASWLCTTVRKWEDL